MATQAATISSIQNITADDSAPRVKLNVSVNNSKYKYQLHIRVDGTSVLSFQIAAMSKGKHSVEHKLTSTQRITLLNKIGAYNKSISAEARLYSFDSNNNQSESYSTAYLQITTIAANSAPVFSDFTFEDTNADTIAITGDEQTFIQNKSTLRVTSTAATAKNGASIARYTAEIEGDLVNGNTVIDYGRIKYSGELTLSVTVTDSRGYTAKLSKLISVMEYTAVTFDYWSLTRINSGRNTKLSFTGSTSPLIKDGVNINPPQPIGYRYMKIPGTWSDVTYLNVTFESDGSFSYSTDSFREFDIDSTYRVQLITSDYFNLQITHDIILAAGIPIVSLQKEKVGINKLDPTSALDVNGDIQMNGQSILGFKGTLADNSDLDDVVTGGFWFINQPATTISNLPVQASGILEVLRAPNFVIQRYTTALNTVYCRTWLGVLSSQNTWTSWKRLDS